MFSDFLSTYSYFENDLVFIFVYLSVFNSLNKINLIWVPHIKYGIDYFIDYLKSNYFAGNVI